MVSVNNVGVSGDNYENRKLQGASEEEKTLISVFNTNGDDVFSVEEQKAAYNSELDKVYNQLKSLFDKAGFKLQEFKDKIFTNLKDENIKDSFEKSAVEYTTQVGINKAISEMADVAKQQYAKEKEEILNNLETSLHIKLLDFDASKEEIYELFDLFNQAMDPNNEQHVKKRDELQNLIDTRFSKKE